MISPFNGYKFRLTKQGKQVVLCTAVRGGWPTASFLLVLVVVLFLRVRTVVVFFCVVRVERVTPAVVLFQNQSNRKKTLVLIILAIVFKHTTKI